MEGLTHEYFGRMSTILQAKASKVLDKAEDPNEKLEYSYDKQVHLLQNVKWELADMVTARMKSWPRERS